MHVLTTSELHGASNMSRLLLICRSQSVQLGVTTGQYAAKALSELMPCSCAVAVDQAGVTKKAHTGLTSPYCRLITE